VSAEPTAGDTGEIFTAHSTIVRHPDRETAWVIGLVAYSSATGRAVDPTLLGSRLSDLRATIPLVAGRLRGETWQRGAPPEPVLMEVDDPIAVLPLHRFDLAEEAPLRVLCAADGTWLALLGHHSAFDGLGMVSIIRSLVTGVTEEASVYRSNARSSGPEVPWPLLKRVLLPAEPVAKSQAVPQTEVLEARTVDLSGKRITSRLAAACARAVVAHNRRRSAPIRGIGISVAVGGTGKEPATYRRIDMKPDGPVSRVVDEALSTPTVPRELVGLPRRAHLLRPVLGRLSDTILVSNLGRQELDHVERLDFFPVARGRSSVAFGCAGVAGGLTTLSIRARYLDRPDARAILDCAVEELGHEVTA
jgi:hypothetical protein